MLLLKATHGIFNLLVMFLFIRQGWLGWQIRKNRLSKTPLFPIIRKHRRLGLLVVNLGICGFFFGLALTFFGRGEIFLFHRHLFTGTALILCITAAFATSRQIKGVASPWRLLHLLLGISILLLYPVQIYFGLRILL